MIDISAVMALDIADCHINIISEGDHPFWDAIKYRYMPFVTANGGDKRLSVYIRNGRYDSSDDTELCNLAPKCVDDIAIRSLIGRDGTYIYEVRHPLCDTPNGALVIDGALCQASIFITETGDIGVDSTTCNICVMMAYMLGTATYGNAIIHASCVVSGGRAYMFIGRSGTGKSTHSRLWLDNIPDSMLLNDDHPIVRLAGEHILAYGSPWSGKTDCYRNISAPIAAIVRLRQAPANKIARIGGDEAFASLFSSFSCLPWIEPSAESRYRAAATLAQRVPVYVMDCRADDDAAIICHDIISK